jgi:hypothetical protein
MKPLTALMHWLPLTAVRQPRMEVANMRPTISALLIATLLAGFATNDYEKFYSSRPGTTAADIAATRASPQPDKPEVVYAAGFDGIADAYSRKGYFAIGSSSFSSGHNEREKGAIEQAEEIGADLVVIINPKFAGSQTTSVPITTPTTSTSYTNGTATAYGPLGTATAFGNATTTTYGSQTTYVPMTVNRYDYGAMYFVKKRYKFGATFRDLDDEERRALQTNRGVFINTIVDGSPAYVSDILPGDIVVSVNGQSVNGSTGFTEILKPNAGRTVEITIVRRGETIVKSVSLLE